MLRLPFALHSGDTAGISTSSYAKIGDIQPSQSLGAAQIKPFINTATGAVFIQGYQSIVDFQGFRLKAGFVSNNGVTRFNQCKSLKFTPYKDTALITVTQGDGAMSVFTYDANAHQYINQTLPGGQQTIEPLSNGGYELTHFATGEVETYDSAGFLIKRQDVHGNHLTYAYSKGTLIRITSGNGAALNLDYNTPNKMVLSYEEGSGNESGVEGSVTHLADYSLSEGFTLVKTRIPLSGGGDYQIEYGYDAHNNLAAITQSDGTALSFGYTQNSLTAITDGEGHTYKVAYATAAATVTTPNGDTFSVTMDKSRDIIEVQKPSEITPEVIKYHYTEGLLESKVTGNGAVNKWVRNSEGLVTRHINGVDTVTDSHRDPVTGLITCVTVCAPGDAPVSEWRVYDERRNLCFSVSALGAVTAFEYDSKGNRIKERILQGEGYDVRGLTPESVLTIEDLNDGLSGQDISDSVLSTFEYNRRGQLTECTRFDTLDKEGKG